MIRKQNLRSLTTFFGRVGLALMFVLTCSLANADSVSLEPGVSVVYESNVATPGTCRLVRSGNSGVLFIPLQVLSTSSASPSDYELEWYDLDGLSGIPVPQWRELGGDEATSGSVAFYNGQTTVDIRVRAVDDALVEGREQLVLAIVSPTLTPPPYIVGQFPSRSFTIADDDHKARIEVVQPVADEDVSLRGDPDDLFSRRRGIINVIFDSFPNVDSNGNPSYAGRKDFFRNLAVQIYRQNDLDGDGKDDETGLKLADLSTDYVIKYKICGHNNPATITGDYSQLGYAANSSGFSGTTGLNYKLMAALPGETNVPLLVPPPPATGGVVPANTQFYFESDTSQRRYTSGSTPSNSSLDFTPALDRPVPNGTAIKIIGSSASDIVVERKYVLGTTVLRLGNGWGELYEGDVIKIDGDTQPYVITADPTVVNTDVNGRLSALVTIFAHEGGSGGGLAVAQTTAAAVTTLLTPVIQTGDIMQIGVPRQSRKVEFSIEPTGQGDGAEGAEFVRMRMIADYDYVIVTPQDALITIADRDVVVGVAVASNAGLPDIQGTLRFTFSKAFPIPITVPFTVSSFLEASPLVSAEGVSFETLPRSVTFAAGQTEYLLRVVPKATGTPASLTITLNGTEDYKTGGSTSSGSNPSATMNIINLMGTVTVVATDAVASEGPSADTGLFTISIARLTGVSGEVALRLGVAGTALVGSRYEFFNPANPTQTYAVSSGYLTQLKILAGTNSVTLGVRALDNQSADGNGSVQLTVNNTGAAYVIGTPNVATVTVQDNEPTLQVSVLSNATRPSTPGTFRFSYPGVPAGSALDQAVVIKYTLTGAVKGVDFDAQSTVTIPAGSPTRSADLIINPTADGTATSLTLTINDDSAYSILSTAKSATMTFTAAPIVDPNDPTKDKPKPGSVNSGSSSGGCGMGSGFAAMVGLGLFALLAFRRRSI
jgi:hypothetical protein